MPTLSSLLLQRDVATLREVDSALARQVVHGGDLATNLLEVARVDEAKLLEVIAEATGLPPAAAGPLPPSEPAALELVPADVAIRNGLLPLRTSAGTLEMAVCELLPPYVEEDLGFALGLRIEQRVTTLVRIRQAIAASYHAALDRRFARLVARLQGEPDPMPSAPPPERPPGESMLPPKLGGWVRQAAAPAPRGGAPAGAAQARDDAVASSRKPFPPEAPTRRAGRPSGEPPAMPPPRAPSRPPSAPPRASAPPLASPSSSPAPLLLPKPPGEGPGTGARRRRGPFTLAMAREALDEAESRGAVLDVLFDFARQFFEYSALFVVHGDLAEGLSASGPGASAERIRGIGVPLEIPSILSAARDRRAHVLGRPDEAGIDAYLREDLQRPMRASVMVIPVAIRHRVVALLYGDEGNADVDLGDAGEVLALLPLVAGALEQLIVLRKLGGARARPAPAVAGRDLQSRTARQKRHYTLRGLEVPGVPEPSARDAPSAAQAGTGEPGDRAPRGVTAPMTGERRHITSPILGAILAPRSSHPPDPGISPAAVSVRAVTTDQVDREWPTRHEERATAPSAASTPGPTPSPPRADVVVAPVISIGPPSADAGSPSRPAVAKPVSPTAAAVPTAPAAPIAPAVPAEPASPAAPVAAARKPDDSPELSYGVIDEPDEMVEAVIAELERSPSDMDESLRRASAVARTAVAEAPRVPPKSQHPDEEGDLPSVIIDLREEVEELLNMVAAGAEPAAAQARAFILRMGAHAAPVVAKRLPGPTQVAPGVTNGELGRASECGPLLRVAVSLGKPMLPHLRAMMGREEPDARAAALLAALEIDPLEATPVAILGLFDEDERVRAIGEAALGPRPLEGPDAERVGRALRASRLIAKMSVADAGLRAEAAAALSDLMGEKIGVEPEAGVPAPEAATARARAWWRDRAVRDLPVS